MSRMVRCIVALAASSAVFLVSLWFLWISHGVNPVPHYITFGNVFRYLTTEESLTSDILIWPSSSNGTFDRVDSQIAFLRKFGTVNKGNVNHTKTILLVGTFYLRLPNEASPFQSCPTARCRLVKETDDVHPRNADVIMFARSPDKKKFTEKFLPKPSKQIWIASHMESPQLNLLHTTQLGSYINWSATYRPDSHIMIPYGRFHRKKPYETSGSSPSTDINWAANKTKKVAWFVSNCYEKNGRRNYAHELAKYIKVDIYGRCGTLTCQKSNGKSCFELLKLDYKFYLAFENANCHFYMTEKLFLNAYSNNVIPVVMGAHPTEYAQALPPHSYIHVDDFDSPRELADYLHRLDADDRLYNEYFRWKTDWSLSQYYYDMCVVCGLLHAADYQKYVHWYPEYTRYWDVNACSSKWKENKGVRWLSW